MVLSLLNIELLTKGFLLKDLRDPIPISYTPLREIRLIDLYLRESEHIYEVRIHLYQGGILPVECKSTEKAHEFFNTLVALMEN